ncbi:MAG: DUF393 domain-containing protein [Pedosphaera sp.]|nr:DUF393 domain-containing protein [Pedosphaera sp.]
MNRVMHVAAPPPKPLLIFDGECDFCGLWISRWRQSAGTRVDFLPFQDTSVGDRFPEIPRAQFERAVQLIETDGAVYGGAEAVFRLLAHPPGAQPWLRWYQASADFAKSAEAAYRFVAGHRPLFSWLTRIGWGRHVEQPRHFLVRGIFLRGLGVVYLIAFLSLWSQIFGLIGRNGILPAEQFISNAGNFFDTHGIGADRHRMLPTLCWFGASDSALRIQCAAGTVLAILVIVGIAPAPCLFLLWLIYLSLSSVCREFLGFQWDILLLETGFLAIFFAPLQLWPVRSVSREPPPSRLVLWLLRWLLFQLMFESGIVKLLSGDATWRDLSALTFHYESQPLPTWIGWHAHQLPFWFQKFSCVVMFVIELAVPFLFFAPRRLRLFGCGATVALQILILLTGNYTFFNCLTLLLCVTLLDDFTLRELLPDRLRRSPALDATPMNREQARKTQHAFRWPRWVLAPLTGFVLCLTAGEFLFTIGARWRVLEPVMALHDYCAPLRTFNSYGLFRVMTTSRPEIIVEGSNDGVNWQPYEFKYKAGDVSRRPAFVAPHQPRLDWQMWFAALGDVRHNPWFGEFCVRLLQGSPEVLALLEKNPFPEKPPRYIRAVLYDYRFTNCAEKRAMGAWWKRKELGIYLPPISLEQIQKPER